ncbi:MAG: SiaC family regulatory phosphoprotein [Candidatus Aminicenantes bacterium]|nr:SiaC family regulatory phosphoprotein [Candidatus Aminicenantes bacterium]
MENLFIAGTKYTLEVNFDLQRGVLEMSGDSYPENAFDFFQPLTKWLKDYLKSSPKSTILDLKVNYLNSSSAKCTLDFLSLLEDYHKKGGEIQVNWYYTEEDDILATAEDITTDLDLPVRIIPSEEKTDSRDLFGSEFKTIETANEIIKIQSGEKDSLLLKEYTLLTGKYEKLLKQTVRITQLGDTFQRKLLSANETIGEHYKALQKANAEIREKNRELTEAYKRIDQIARTDPLTKLSNRRDILERIQAEKERFVRFGRPFALVLADIDNFKFFNDRFGHDCGDFVLVRAAEVMSSVIRKIDSIGRWGGEEFILLLPENDLEGGCRAAEKVREKVAAILCTFKDLELSISMTFGVSIYDGSGNIEDCIKKADQALFLGKEKGKNCVVASPGK